MKPSHFVALFLFAFVTACSKPPPGNSTADADERIKALETELARLKATATPSPKPTGELTREAATALLNEHLANPHIGELCFKKGGLDEAKADGLVVETGGRRPDLRFTEKGLALTQGLANAATLIATVSNDAFIVTRLEDPVFPLPAPIGERVTEITGIALGSDPNLCEVEYGTAYFLPAEAAPLKRYLYSGQKAKTTFRKYDNGWRVVAQ